MLPNLCYIYVVPPGDHRFPPLDRKYIHTLYKGKNSQSVPPAFFSLNTLEGGAPVPQPARYSFRWQGARSPCRGLTPCFSATFWG